MGWLKKDKAKKEEQDTAPENGLVEKEENLSDAAAGDQEPVNTAAGSSSVDSISDTVQTDADADVESTHPDSNEFIYKVMQFSSESTDPAAIKAGKKKKRRRTALTVCLVVLAVVCVLGATALGLFHDIYSKLNYTDEPTEDELNAAIAQWKEAQSAGLLDDEGEEEILYDENGQPIEETVTEVDPGLDLSQVDISEYPEYEALLAYSEDLAAQAGDLYAQADELQREADEYAALAQMRLEYDEEQARLEEERIKNEIMAAMEADGGDPITDENVINILLIGTDTRDINNQYSRSDAMILLSVNKNTKEIILTSFMRDSYVYIPGADDYNRLNAANAIGGPTLLCRTISSTFGVDVDKYATVNFFSFIDIVDALGGLDIEVTEEEIGHLNDNLVHQNYVRGYEDEMDFIEHGTAGMMHLNGNQALAYARIRYVGGDSGRTARQRLVISLIIDKVRSMSITELYNLLDVVLPLVRTNVTELECLSVVLNSADYIDYTVKSIRLPYDGAFKYAQIDGMSVLEIEIDRCRSYLKRQIYG